MNNNNIKVEVKKDNRTIDTWYIDCGEEQSELEEIKLTEIYKGCRIYMDNKLRLTL